MTDDELNLQVERWKEWVDALPLMGQVEYWEQTVAEVEMRFGVLGELGSRLHQAALNDIEKERFMDAFRRIGKLARKLHDVFGDEYEDTEDTSNVQQ